MADRGGRVEQLRAEAPAEIVTPTCVVAVGHPAGTLTIDGVALTDFKLATLRAVLGEPDRVERIAREERYDEAGEDTEAAWTSTLVTVVDFHQVYERRGLVFSTRNRIYTVEGRRHVVLFLDEAATGRPSYAEILKENRPYVGLPYFPGL